MADFIYPIVVTVLLLFGVIMTVLYITASNSNNKNIRRIRALEQMIRDLQRGNVPASAPAPAPAQPVAQAPAVPEPAPAPEAAAFVPAQEAGTAYRPAEYTYIPDRPVSVPAASVAPAAVQPSAPAPKKQRLGAVGVSFSVGILLMVIAAAVFISATWQTMAAGAKCVILAAVVAVVYGFSAFCSKKLKLEKTSSVLYMLGSLITPLAIVVGFMAFGSTETVIMLGCCALSLGITGFLGYKIFGSKLQVAISYIGFVWLDIFICMESVGNYTGFVVGLCSAALISGLVNFIRPNLRFFGTFAEVTAYCATLGFFMSAAIHPHQMVWSLVSQIFFFVSLLLLTKKRPVLRYISAAAPLFTLCIICFDGYVTDRTAIGIICLVSMIGLFVLYRIIKHENPASNALIGLGISILMLCMARAPIYNGSSFIRDTRDFLYYLSLFVCVAAPVAVIIMTRFKTERTIYWYFLFGSLIILFEGLLTGVAPLYIMAGIAAAAVFVSLKTGHFNLPIAACAAALVEYIVVSTRMTDGMGQPMLILAMIYLAIYAGIVFIKKFMSVDKKVWTASRYSVFVHLVCTQFGLLFNYYSDDGRYLVFIIAMDIIFTVITMFDTDNYFAWIPALSFLLVVTDQLVKLGMDNMLIGLIFIILYVTIGRFLICERIVKKDRVDFLTFVAGLACFLPVGDHFFKATFLMTLYTLTFIGRFADGTVEEKIRSKLRTILSVATGMLAFSFAIVDVDYTDVMDTEIRLLFILAAGAVIHFLIKPGKGSKWIWFSAVTFCLEIEACKALMDANLPALTLVSVFAIAIFIYSFVVKKRSWFILSIVMIAQFGLLFAAVFWESRLWWVYLLILGVIVITTASVNEYRRRQAVLRGEEKGKLFADWTW